METPQSKTIWRHYKSTGGDDYTYEVLGIAVHSETLEEMVVYKTLYDSGDTPGKKPYPKGTVFVRPLSMWFEEVEYNGKAHSRFTEIK